MLPRSMWRSAASLTANSAFDSGRSGSDDRDGSSPPDMANVSNQQGAVCSSPSASSGMNEYDDAGMVLNVGRAVNGCR